jgi:hypothetical protein
VERLWDWLKRNAVRNRFHKTVGALMDTVGDYMREEGSSAFLKSLCGCNYILQ